MDHWICFSPLILILAVFFLYLYLCVRKACAIRRVCAMPMQDKLAHINELASPFGFEYRLSQDLFTSRTGAWQKDYGYCRAYDLNAPLFHMVLDCEPVYFDCGGTTWLIEFWKGQYGISSGCEIGIYRADRILSRDERKRTLFHSASAEEMPVFSITFLKDGLPVSRLFERHWWLTDFCVGRYTVPESLTVKIAVIFSSQEMCLAFLSGLEEAGYPARDIYVNGNALFFTFSEPHSVQPLLRRSWYGRWVLLKNRMLLRIYMKITEPFYFTVDRMLLLYEYLPFLFRSILSFRHMKKKGRRFHI